MPQTQARPRAQATGADLLALLGRHGRAVVLLLLFVILVVCLYWLGGQVGRMTQLQRQQEEQIAQLRAQLRALDQQAAGSGQARPAAGLGQQPGAETSPAKGSILSPAPGQAVPEVFECTVKVRDPSPGHHYYLVLRQGAQYWPCQEVKMPPGGATTAWELRRDRATAAGPFSLELREVDQEQHQRITQWRQWLGARPNQEPAGGLLDVVNLTSK